MTQHIFVREKLSLVSKTIKITTETKNKKTDFKQAEEINLFVFVLSYKLNYRTK